VAGGGEGGTGYLDGAVARAAEHDLVEARGALDELHRRAGGGGHLTTRPRDGGAGTLTLFSFLLQRSPLLSFSGFFWWREKERKRRKLMRKEMEARREGYL
jgi:hypothetical protein